jgi:dipeptidase D
VIHQLEGVFETVNNFETISTEGGVVTVTNSARSNIYNGLPQLGYDLSSLASSIGANISIEQRYPAWPYKADSPLRDRMAAVFREFYGREPAIKPTAGGLDCAAFIQKMPDTDMVSIGPDILDIHTPDERMSFASFNRVYDYLVRVLREL